MFYSQSTQTIETKNTHLHPQQVFSGNYWDEFGLTPFLIPENAKVLMLGLSLGGGIRPILASTKKISLTCLDIDENSVLKCQTLFKNHFPLVEFKTEIADAKVFLQTSQEKYDLIWLDIYENDSYCKLCFDIDFLNSLRSGLSESGVLAVNAFGIPNQFKPLEKTSVQQELAGQLQSVFAYVGNIPYRRNQTFLASQQKPEFYPATPHSDLAAIDKKSFVIQGLRLQNLTLIPSVIDGDKNPVSELKFAAIDQRMREGWFGVVEKLKSYGIEISVLSELLTLIQDEKQCSALLDQALQRQDDFISFVVVLAAGESHIRELNIRWIFDWTLMNQERLAATVNLMYRQIWLPQLWALVLHPSKRYRSYCFQVSQSMQESK